MRLFWRRGIAAALVALVALTTAQLSGGSAPAYAAVTDNCASGSTQNQLTVTPNHGKNFYIDSGQGQRIDAGYVSYTVKNSSGSIRSNLWVQLSNFTGGKLALANPEDSVMPLSTLAASTGSATSFFMLKASGSANTQQSHQVRVFSGKPGLAGSTELYSCTYTFTKVAETIKAAANKVTSMSQLPSTTTVTLGDKFIVKVEGQTGTIGSGNSIDGSVLWLSPAARSSWPTQSLRLEATSITFKRNNTPLTPITNDLAITLSEIRDLAGPSGSNAKSFTYEATYTFRMIGIPATAAKPSPVAQIASGTQMKHTDMGGVDSAATAAFSAGIPVSTNVNLAATKSISTTATVGSGTTTFSYSISLQNTGSTELSVDRVADTPANGLSYVSGSARYNSAAMNEPALNGSNQLIFTGPFVVPANSTRVLTYQMSVSTCGSGSYSYSNSVVAQIGAISIGSNATSYQELTASGTCGSTVVTPTVTTIPLPIEPVTGPVSALGTTTATITGTVDSNGTQGVATRFEWGTSPTLATSTSVALSPTTTATTPVAYNAALTGLSTGTVYYYRIVAGSDYGQIFSFVTDEPVAAPTILTTQVSNLASAGGSNISATLGAQVDPNQTP